MEKTEALKQPGSVHAKQSFKEIKWTGGQGAMLYDIILIADQIETYIPKAHNTELIC